MLESPPRSTSPSPPLLPVPVLDSAIDLDIQSPAISPPPALTSFAQTALDVHTRNPDEIDVVPPVHPVTAILSRASSRPPGSPNVPYDSDSVELKALFQSFACPIWADIFHSLSHTDQVIAIGDAKHCHQLSTPAGKLLFNWPYDDGSITATQSNSLVSSQTGSSYNAMNQPGHGVYTEIQPAQTMSIHLTIDSDMAITEDKSVHYFRVDVPLGRFLMGWANTALDRFAIRQYNETGRLLNSSIGQYLKKRPNKRDCPMIRFSPSSGSGTCPWCLEPFIACLLVPQRCFISRPLTTGMHDGYALGGLCNFSIDLGINCIGSGTSNTYIIHRPTGTLYWLTSVVATGNDPASFADVSASGDVANAGISGKPKYLWRHSDCPGQYGTGCYRFSQLSTQFQSASTTRTSRSMRCHIQDGSLPKRLYLIKPTIPHWHRVPMANADEIIALAIDKTVKWLDDIGPADLAVSATV